MKYHSLLSGNQGLNTLPTNPCKLLDFALLKLGAGETYSAETSGREILAVILGGRASFEINGQRFEKVGGRPNVFTGKPHSVYIPAGAKFSIQAEGAVEIALPSAPSDRDRLSALPHRPCPGRQRYMGRGQLQALFPPDLNHGCPARAARPAVDRR